MNHPNPRDREAEHLVAKWFLNQGWEVEPGGPNHADFVLHIGEDQFEVEVKSLSEGRPDRVVPLLAQAILEAKTYSERAKNSKPMAVVCVNNIPAALFNNVLGFAEKHAPGVAVGILSADGLGLLKLADKNSIVVDQRNELRQKSRTKLVPPTAPQSVNLFSDLNQWMLKVLLSREVPEAMLTAPRGEYRTGAELAAGAKVSGMSVSRFLQQLRDDGFLGESPEGHLRLVRRQELFDRWGSFSLRRGAEAPMKFLFRASVPQQIDKLVQAQVGAACLGMFSAADALGLGFVSGVPPYIYVKSLPGMGGADTGWEMVKPFPEGTPDFIARQSIFAESTMRGAVHREGKVFTDVIQTWLDVAHHPSRGQEQADLILHKVIRPLIEASP